MHRALRKSNIIYCLDFILHSKLHTNSTPKLAFNSNKKWNFTTEHQEKLQDRENQFSIWIMTTWKKRKVQNKENFNIIICKNPAHFHFANYQLAAAVVSWWRHSTLAIVPCHATVARLFMMENGFSYGRSILDYCSNYLSNANQSKLLWHGRKCAV